MSVDREGVCRASARGPTRVRGAAGEHSSDFVFDSFGFQRYDRNKTRPSRTFGGIEKCQWNTEKHSSKTVSKIKSEIGRGNDSSCKAYGTRVRGGGPLCPGARRAAAGTPPPPYDFLK